PDVLLNKVVDTSEHKTSAFCLGQRQGGFLEAHGRSTTANFSWLMYSVSLTHLTRDEFYFASSPDHHQRAIMRSWRQGRLAAGAQPGRRARPRATGRCHFDHNPKQ